MQEEILKCSFCGVFEKWGDCHIFYCEKCDAIFCTRCGERARVDFLADELICPNCREQAETKLHESEKYGNWLSCECALCGTTLRSGAIKLTANAMLGEYFDKCKHTEWQFLRAAKAIWNKDKIRNRGNK